MVPPVRNLTWSSGSSKPSHSTAARLTDSSGVSARRLARCRAQRAARRPRLLARLSFWTTSASTVRSGSARSAASAVASAIAPFRPRARSIEPYRASMWRAGLRSRRSIDRPSSCGDGCLHSTGLLRSGESRTCTSSGSPKIGSAEQNRRRFMAEDDARVRHRHGVYAHQIPLPGRERRPPGGGREDAASYPDQVSGLDPALRVRYLRRAQQGHWTGCDHWLCRSGVEAQRHPCTMLPHQRAWSRYVFAWGRQRPAASCAGVDQLGAPGVVDRTSRLQWRVETKAFPQRSRPAFAVSRSAKRDAGCQGYADGAGVGVGVGVGGLGGGAKTPGQSGAASG